MCVTEAEGGRNKKKRKKREEKRKGEKNKTKREEKEKEAHLPVCQGRGGWETTMTHVVNDSSGKEGEGARANLTS